MQKVCLILIENEFIYCFLNTRGSLVGLLYEKQNHNGTLPSSTRRQPTRVVNHPQPGGVGRRDANPGSIPLFPVGQLFNLCINAHICFIRDAKNVFLHEVPPYSRKEREQFNFKGKGMKSQWRGNVGDSGHATRTPTKRGNSCLVRMSTSPLVGPCVLVKVVEKPLILTNKWRKETGPGIYHPDRRWAMCNINRVWMSASVSNSAVEPPLAGYWNWITNRYYPNFCKNRQLLVFASGGASGLAVVGRWNLCGPIARISSLFLSDHWIRVSCVSAHVRFLTLRFRLYFAAPASYHHVFV